MNSKLTKERSSHSQTPSQSSRCPIQLSDYFSKRNTNACTLSAINNKPHNESLLNAMANKQNYCLDIINTHTNHKQLKDNKVVNKRKKVIHLRSHHKNSRSNQASRTPEKPMEHVDVTPFDEPLISNHKSQQFKSNHSIQQRSCLSQEKSPLVIELDLHKCRKSIQDTLASSGAMLGQINDRKPVSINNVETISSLGPNYEFVNSQYRCRIHPEKPATFQMRGQGYCDKCAAELITKGNCPLVRIKVPTISTQKPAQEGQISSRQRNEKLNRFIEQIDKYEPRLELLSTQLTQYSEKLNQHYEMQATHIQNYYSRAIFSLNSLRKQLQQELMNQQASSFQFLQQLYSKLGQQLSNLKFMRNDIIQNINKIVCPQLVSPIKFEEVFASFQDQLKDILLSFRELGETSLSVPEVFFDQLSLQEEMRKCWNLNHSSQQIYIFGTNAKGKESEGIPNQPSEDSNSFPLSFGRELGKIQSPAFKAI